MFVNVSFSEVHFSQKAVVQVVWDQLYVVFVFHVFHDIKGVHG